MVKLQLSSLFSVKTGNDAGGALGRDYVSSHYTSNQFEYRSFDYYLNEDVLTITFEFAIQSLETFSPTLTLAKIPADRWGSVPKPVLDNLVFHVGLVEMLSYWKATASQAIVISCGSLTKEQIDWWKQLLTSGMGEYCYKNQIPLDAIASVEITSKGDNRSSAYKSTLKDRALVPIGGGKDSIVTAELLWRKHLPFCCFLLNATSYAVSISDALVGQSPVRVERIIDQKLLALNKRGFLNGHVPFSAYLAFLTTLCAVLFDYRDIVLSNERSANQANVVYEGMEINHQYSKTFGFEQAFHDYAITYLAKNVNYFSMLRPTYELQIAKIFSQFFNKYGYHFLSCNVGQKDERWCGKCPKCLFVYTILYPFVDHQELKKILGHDLYADKSLLPLLQELLGLKATKPFECVGTYEEVRAALYLSLPDKTNKQVLLDYFVKEILPNYPEIEKEANNILSSWNNENLVPKNYQQILEDALL